MNKTDNVSDNESDTDILIKFSKSDDDSDNNESDDDSDNNESDDDSDNNEFDNTPCELNLDSVLTYIHSDDSDNYNIVDKIYKITGINNSNNDDWGSSTYSSCKSMYEFLNFFLNDLNTSDEVYKILKFDIKNVKLHCRKKESTIVNAFMKKYKNECSEEDCDEIANNIDNYTTIQDCFILMKDNELDLYDSINNLWDIMYPKYEMKKIPIIRDSETNNMEYGIKCWHLVNNNYLNNDDNQLFRDFSI